MKIIFPLLSILIISCKGSLDKKQAGNVNTDKVEFAMNKNVDSLLLDSTINAVSIGIYKDRQTYIKHYGELDKGKGNTPTNKTIYEIASISKTFTGTLVAQAELEGRLNLDDSVQKYLKEGFSGLSYHDHPVKIRDLITHTGRLPKFLPNTIQKLFRKPTDSLAFKVHELENEYSKEQFLSDLKSFRIDTIPGIKYDYSNVAPELMVHILETIYGKQYNQLLQEKICNKIGMKSTGTILPEALKTHLANGYTFNNVLAPHMPKTLWGGDGGIMSTIPDMIKYIEFQLDVKNNLAMKSHQTVYEDEKVKLGYYWPIKYDENNGTYYRHHGGALGMQSLLFVIPKRKLGIIIVINQSLFTTGKKLYKLMNGILKDLK